MIRPPVDRPEGSKLEFKAAEVLSGDRLARDVAAFLNADGGELWIGIADDRSVVGVQDAASKCRSALDQLVDRIEPRPTSEITIDVVPWEDKELIRVGVTPTSARRPYAVRVKDGYQFPVRVGDRVRPLGFAEIRDVILNAAGAAARQKEAVDTAVQEVVRARERLRGTERLALRLVPVPAMSVSLKTADARRLFRDPAATGNRSSGWSFVNPYADPVPLARGWKGGILDATVTVGEHGQVDLDLPLQALFWKGEPKELFPFALIEHPVAVLRLAKELYAAADASHVVVADLVLFGLRGWKLGQGSPRSIGYRLRPMREYGENDFEEAPLQLTAGEIVAAPDRCAWRLLARVWRAFGYTEEQIPTEFTADGGLRLPE